MFDKLLEVLHGRKVSAQPVTAPLRWIVLDTETSGLSLWKDHLISIAAVAVVSEPGFRRARIVLADRFEVILHQARPTRRKDNILIHHIGVDAQRTGQDPVESLGRFAVWMGDAPVFAFHAPFDRAMIARAFKSQDLPAMRNTWVDVAAMASWIRRDTVSVSLDDRLREFGLECFERHQASADMFATAELLLRMLPDVRKQTASFNEMVRFCADNARPVL